uniref:Uncharacterized protein n=1 Tax=Acrobeloides nanus TaxID=290746 RepID=A0A914DSL5_9BILA
MSSPIPLFNFLLLIKSFILVVKTIQTPCADQTQRCGILIEEFERQIQDVKALAFRRCFISTSCLQERLAFDDCYAKSIRAVRAPFNGDSVPNDSFFDSAERYSAQIEQCFGGVEHPKDLPSMLNDEDSIYARSVFSTEFSDRLWGLSEATFTESIMDPHEACMVKDYPTRIFGGGISRIVDSSNPKLNNYNTSCLLNANEITCYKTLLVQDDRFQQLVKQRDRSLRSCIQSIRAQEACRTGDGSRFRSCVCNAREEFENRLQASLLECTRKSEVGQLYSIILRYSQQEGLLNNDSGFGQYRLPVEYQRTPSSEQRSHVAQKYETTDQNQCSCTCDNNQGKTYPSYHSYSDHSASIYQPETVTAAAHISSSDEVQGANYQYPYYQNYYYQRPGLFSASFDPTEAVADGFKRFWHGLPPVRRRIVKRAKRT